MKYEKLAEITSCKPNQLNEEKLNEYIDLLWIDTASRSQSGDLYAALLSEKASRQNKVTVRWSLFLSILAVTFASISLIFSVMDWNGDKSWQAKQLQELKNQSRFLEQIANIAQPPAAPDAQQAAHP